MTSYQRRTQERDTARKEVYELKKLIRDIEAGKADRQKVISIAMNFQIAEDAEKAFWNGTPDSGNEMGGILSFMEEE